jgi:hypothetical protein
MRRGLALFVLVLAALGLAVNMGKTLIVALDPRRYKKGTPGHASAMRWQRLATELGVGFAAGGTTYLGAGLDAGSGQRHARAHILERLQRAVAILGAARLAVGPAVIAWNRALVLAISYEFKFNGNTTFAREVDKAARRAVRRAAAGLASLPKCAWHMSPDTGGIGLYSLEADAPRLVIDTALELLNSSHESTRMAARTAWHWRERLRGPGRAAASHPLH